MSMEIEGSGGVTSPIFSSTGELSGYLYKKTRDGRWQRRFFETHSVYLTYYKSKKKQKILAALGLAQVGEIKSIAASDEPDKHEGAFSLELNSRIYILRARTPGDAEIWVNCLIKLRAKGISELSSSSGSCNDDGKEKLTDFIDDNGVAKWVKRYYCFSPCC